MTERLRRASAVVFALVCVGGPAAAAQQPDRQATAAFAVRASTAGAHAGSAAIHGGAWTFDNLPIKQARLRLRNVVTGKIEGATVANDAGQFAFDAVPGGSYLVELVDAAGHIQVVGHVFAVAPGETVATFVRTSAKVSWFAGFFNNSVSAVASTAAAQGVTALAPVARAVSPNQ